MTSRIEHAPDHGEPIDIKPRGSMTTKQKLEVMIAHGHCYICGLKLTSLEDTEFDHVKPLALGGSDELANKAPAHRACHKAKTATDIGIIRKADRQRKRHRGEHKPQRPLKSRNDLRRRKERN